MRRFITVALIGLAVTVTANDAAAQGRQGGRQRSGVTDTARMRRMDSIRVARGDTALRGRGMGPMGGRSGLMGLQLNDNEKAAVKTISEKYRAEYQKVREANKATDTTRRGRNPQAMAQVQAIAEREQAEIRGALTAEHQAQFDANLAKRKEHAAKGQGSRRGHRPPTASGR